MATTEGRDGRDVYTQSTHTRVLCRFHSDQNPNGEVIAIGGPEGTDERFGRLIGVQTDKRLDDPTGAFTILVKKPSNMSPSRSLSRIWPDPEDVWVEIVWLVEGQPFHTMTGLVDHVTDSMTRMEGGKRIETFTITGRDIGKVFAQTQLWINLYDFGTEELVSIAEYTNAMKDRVGPFRPDEFVRLLLESWLGNNGLAEHQWLLPGSMGGTSFYDKLELDGIEEMDAGAGRISDPTILTPDHSGGFGTLWDCLSRYQNDLLNEMWVDLETPELGADASSLKPTIYLRERPFPTRLSGRTKWDALPTQILEPRDIMRRHVSKGGAASRYNYWMISSQGLISMSEQAITQVGRLNGVEQGKPGSIPIWNQDSIRRHGVRRWMRPSLYLAFSEQVLAHLAAVWLQRVHDWYAIAPMQYSGTIITNRPFPEFRVGHRLLEKRLEGDVEYYIEGVSHMWKYPNASQTTLTVTRGEFTDQDLLGALYDEIERPKTLDQESCLELSGAVDSALGGDILGGLACKFDGVIRDEQRGRAEVVLGGVGENYSGLATPDKAAVEQAGKALLSEGSSPFGGDSRNSPRGNKGGMVPPKDRQDKQADEIARGNVGSRIEQPSRGAFDQDALERGDDPLAGFDDESSNDDPLFGIEGDL